MQAAVTSQDASRYVFKNESIPPFSPYQVKVGVYNNKGEGPFSPVTTIYSAEEGVYDYNYAEKHTNTVPVIPLCNNGSDRLLCWFQFESVVVSYTHTHTALSCINKWPNTENVPHSIDWVWHSEIVIKHIFSVCHFLRMLNVERSDMLYLYTPVGVQQ